MTTDEAYQVAMDAVKEIQAAGVRVTVKPSKSAKNPEMVAKYSGPERVSPDKWVHVTFYPETDEHKELVFQKAKELGWLGIGFDTGGMVGLRDWELDWSFRYTGVPDGGREHAMGEVETFIRENMEGEQGND